jgi:hypothetical protein
MLPFAAHRATDIRFKAKSSRRTGWRHVHPAGGLDVVIGRAILWLIALPLLLLPLRFVEEDG